MMRKFLLCASLVGMTLLGTSASTQETPNQTKSSKQSQQATQSVSGKVASIGDGGRSFTLEINEGTTGKHTMAFVVDQNTQIQGQVKTGTAVTVEYQAMGGGQNLAISVSAQA